VTVRSTWSGPPYTVGCTSAHCRMHYARVAQLPTQHAHIPTLPFLFLTLKSNTVWLRFTSALRLQSIAYRYNVTVDDHTGWGPVWMVITVAHI